MQLNEVDLMIQRAELDLEAAWNELAATAGIAHLARTPLIGELEAPLGERDAETVYQQIISTSPLLASARARVDRARANLQLQQQQPIPNITAQLGAGHDDATGDEFANVQFSLPLPLHNRNQGNVRAAHAEYCEAMQNVQRLMLQIRRDLAGVMREYQIARVTVEQYESSILPKANESLDLIQQAQDAGQIDFLRVLTARRMFFDANLEYIQALGNLAQADAKLDGLLLSGGLENVPTYDAGDDLRGQALSNQ
jgi:outer membrane protein, heavy metal efflux system